MPYPSSLHFFSRPWTFARVLGGVVLGGLVLLGCDQADLDPPEPPPAGDQFASYVAIGNSITAGFQSDGLTDSGQNASYAVKVAEQMGTEFNSPLINDPGCPPPITNPLTGERAGGATDETCALRQTPSPEVLHNVAVPGAAAVDVFDNFDEDSNANELTLLLLGGRTQIEAVAAAEPTFVSVWIGNNDLLNPALSGDPARATTVSTFRDRYAAVLDSLDSIGVERGVLMAVGDVTLLPHLSPGAAYFKAKQEGQLPPSFTVDDSCRPDQAGTTTLVPFRYGFGTLLRAAQGGQAVTLDCVDDEEVLTGTEVQTFRARVQGYNQFIEERAQERGWAFVDLNPIFASLRESGDIPSFPNVNAPQEAFGAYFSLDGVHPSDLAHDVVTNQVIEAINATYDTDIDPLPDVPDPS